MPNCISVQLRTDARRALYSRIVCSFPSNEKESQREKAKESTNKANEILH